MHSPTTARNAEAILWVALGTALFSIFYVSGKLVGDLASPLQVVFLRYLGGFGTLACIAALRGRRHSVYLSRRPLAHFARAAFGCYGVVGIVYASANMPVVDVSAIGLLYVVFVIPLGMIFLGERVGRSQWAAIVLSAAGAAIVMQSRGAFRTFDAAYLWPALVALCGAVLFAMEGILISTLSRADTAMTNLLYMNFFGILLILLPAALTWRSTELAVNLQLLLFGPVAISAQYLIIRGYRIANISVVGPIDYSWIVFAAIIGLVLFDEIPTVGVAAGALLITIGGILLAVLRPAPPAGSPTGRATAGVRGSRRG